MTDIPSDAIKETWENAYEKSLELARIIEAHCKKTGEKFDAMVVVPRGSYYPVNIVARELGFESVDLLHACIGTYINGTTERHGKFILGQMPSADEVAGKDLLIIEEVCETGHTLKFLTDRLRAQGAGLVRVGALHYKPQRSETGFIPDWYVAKTDKWIVYPWEVNEKPTNTSPVKRHPPN